MANEKYLTAEQEAKFMEQLGANSQTSPDANAPVEDNGGAAAVESAPATAEAEPAVDPNAAILEELGAKSVEDLANQLKEAMGQTKQYREMLSQLLAYQQALDNKAEVEPDDPLNTVKKAVREEMGPIYEKLQREAQNKIVQEAWGKDARNMPDLTDMMPEITAFIQEHPELAVANDGLRRAYDGVRSKNYRSEKQLLEDDKFIERMASNEKIKDAVIKEYLSTAARNGEGVPTSISGGGNVPLTGKKQAPSSMEQAKRGLAQMLGIK